MENVQIYYGDGRGKTAAAVGFALQAVSAGKNVIMIQFLKGKNSDDYAILEKFEPEIRLFRFEKSEDRFADLSQREQVEETSNIRNALNYAKKVLSTGESDLVILDEVLGLVDEGVATSEEITQIISNKYSSTAVIMTGWHLDEGLKSIADAIYKIDVEKE